MAGPPKSYTGAQVVIDVAGLRISGYGDGEFLTIEQDSDDTADVVGTDGEVAVGYTNDTRASFTIKLLQTSASNDDLSALRNRQKRIGQPGLGPIYVRDMNGRTVHQGATCWIARPPNRSFDKEAKTVEWKLRVADLDRVDGGNAPL